MLLSELIGDPLPDGVEAVVEVLAGPVGEPEVALPVLAHVVGRAEAPGVVHDRAAAEAGAREQAHALVVGGDAAAVQVEAGVPGQLGAVEVLLGVVAAGLEHHHVEARRGEHARGRAAAGARAHDHHVAVELGVRRDLQRRDRLAGRVLGRAERPRIAERLVHRVGALAQVRQAVVAQQDALAERLEGGARADLRGVGPGEQRALALGLGERREGALSALPPSCVSQASSSPANWSRSALLGLLPTAISMASGTPQVGGRRQPLLARHEGVADGVERPAGVAADLERLRFLHVPTSS